MISLSSALPPLVRSLVQFTVAVYVVGAQPVAAAEELLLHVLSAGAPVSGASVVIDGVTRGRTLKDGSLLVDINGLGAHTLAVETAEGTVNARFTAGTGQLVDAIVTSIKRPFHWMSTLEPRVSKIARQRLKEP